MTSVSTAPVTLVRWRGSPEHASDVVAVEEPLEVRANGRPVAVVMRTPGHDEELAVGFLYTEGILTSAADVLGVAPGAKREGNVLNVSVPVGLLARTALNRNFYASSSCGVCGKGSLESIAVRHPRVDAPLTVAPATLLAMPAQLRAAQAAFATTGGLHGAALFDATGALLAAREDVGRHNAVDKLVGWALRSERLPLAGSVLFVSGRVSFELVQKAVAAGIPLLAAVSAPTSLAVQTAERFGVTLVAFVREGSLNVYTHAHRVGPGL